MNISIYGAQSIALGLFESLKILYPEKNVVNFLVTNKADNVSLLAGLPVVQIDDFAGRINEEQKSEFEIWIATPESVQASIIDTLINYGFINYVVVTSLMWGDIVAKYHEKKGDIVCLRNLSYGAEKAKVSGFQALSHKDQKLTDTYETPNWLIPIQSGASLTSLELADYKDNTGDNISYKNGNYCELTGLYWMWKNELAIQREDSGCGTAAYHAFMQYRRILDICDEDFRRIAANDIDVVLPFPMPYENGIDEHHKRYLKESDWNALVKAMEELYPDYAKAFLDILKQRYLYNYNIILAKNEILMEYCQWLFPLLARTEQLSVPKGDERSDRYIGYMGETLETLFFMKNKERFKIAHAVCRFLK